MRTPKEINRALQVAKASLAGATMAGDVISATMLTVTVDILEWVGGADNGFESSIRECNEMDKAAARHESN